MISELFEISNFIRTFRRKTRFGRLSRERLELRRLQWQQDSAVCELVARRRDAFDESLREDLAERNEAVQALEDAMAVLDILFARFPTISLVHLQLFRRTRHSVELIIAGTVRREDRLLGGNASLAMRAKLCGLQFTFDDGKLQPMRVEQMLADVANR